MLVSFNATLQEVMNQNTNVKYGEFVEITEHNTLQTKKINHTYLFK